MLLENQEELGFVRFGGWFWRIVLLTRLGNDGIVSFEARKERIGLKERTKKEIERVVIWRKGKKEGEGRRPLYRNFERGGWGSDFGRSLRSACGGGTTGTTFSRWNRRSWRLRD